MILIKLQVSVAFPGMIKWPGPRDLAPERAGVLGKRMQCETVRNDGDGLQSTLLASSVHRGQRLHSYKNQCRQPQSGQQSQYQLPKRLIRLR